MIKKTKGKQSCQKGTKLIDLPKFLGHKGTKRDLRDGYVTFRIHLHACIRRRFLHLKLSATKRTPAAFSFRKQIPSNFD